MPIEVKVPPNVLRVVDTLRQHPYNFREVGVSIDNPRGYNPNVVVTLAHDDAWHLLGPYEQFSSWDDLQILRALLSVLGLRDQLLKLDRSIEQKKGNRKMQGLTPQDDTQREAIRQAGEKTAKAMLPMLRTDVPNSTIFDFAMLVSGWCGYPDNANFLSGFVNYFQTYKELNNIKAINSPLIAESRKYMMESRDVEKEQ